MSETVQMLILSGHIMVGILLITIILIQRGKGSDAGMAFGGGASGTVFGAAGSGTFLTKTTKWLAVTFFCTSLALAYVHNKRVAPESILDRIDVTEEGAISDSLNVPGLEIAPTNFPDISPASDETVVTIPEVNDVPPAADEPTDELKEPESKKQ